ncbi:MAG TPA: VWA domain-containing protein [Bryobacteraceae bacterium]|jgi:Ca-activated chloride channel family protein
MIEPRGRPELRALNQAGLAANLPLADLHSDASLVLVPAHVTNPIGAPITDLVKENFHILEDGVEQPIKYFATEETPVSVGFLFDSSASMRNKMHQSSEAAAAFFRTAIKDDEFFLVEFGESAKLSMPFTTDANEVSQRVAHVRPLGRTSLLDAIHLALVQMKRAKHARKAIVIVSDGGDNRSRYTVGQIKEAMQESDVQVYSMGIFDPEDQRKRTPEEKNGPFLLSELAEQSGGKHYSVDNLEDLPAISAQIGEELRSQYVLGYTPPSTEKDGKYHKIKLMLTAPLQALELRYRRGYYSPQP